MSRSLAMATKGVSTSAAQDLEHDPEQDLRLDLARLAEVLVQSSPEQHLLVGAN